MRPQIPPPSPVNEQNGRRRLVFFYPSTVFGVGAWATRGHPKKGLPFPLFCTPKVAILLETNQYTATCDARNSSDPCKSMAFDRIHLAPELLVRSRMSPRWSVARPPPCPCLGASPSWTPTPEDVYAYAYIYIYIYYVYLYTYIFIYAQKST